MWVEPCTWACFKTLLVGYLIIPASFLHINTTTALSIARTVSRRSLFRENLQARIACWSGHCSMHFCLWKLSLHFFFFFSCKNFHSVTSHTSNLALRVALMVPFVHHRYNHMIDWWAPAFVKLQWINHLFCAENSWLAVVLTFKQCLPRSKCHRTSGHQCGMSKTWSAAVNLFHREMYRGLH